MSNKSPSPVKGRVIKRRIVGVDPKNMSVLQRNTMIECHMGDIRRAMAANEYGDIVMFANRIKLLAELNEEVKQKK